MSKNNKIKEQNAEQTKEEKKRNTWFQNTLLGIVILVCGILFKFFPQIVSSIFFIAFGVIMLFVGITDGLAALKYKDDDDDWKTPLLTGAMSIFVSLLFGAAYWFKIPNMNTIMLNVVGVWGVVRCLLLLYGIFKGSVKRKGSIVSALVTGILGLLVLVFQKAITLFINNSGDIVGYVFLGIGAVVIFFGLYQRADAREKKEKAQRDKIAQKAAEEALKAAEEKEKEEKKAEEADETENIIPPVI